jgi:hypothetical protein
VAPELSLLEFELEAVGPGFGAGSLELPQAATSKAKQVLATKGLNVIIVRM